MTSLASNIEWHSDSAVLEYLDAQHTTVGNYQVPTPPMMMLTKMRRTKVVEAMTPTTLIIIELMQKTGKNTKMVNKGLEQSIHFHT